ncbi:miz zinc finger family [Schistosoma japonicum]|nr:miz zinc finger family [Schistosoma japonicum]
MIPYDKSLFIPFHGPFFKPLWQLHKPYSYFYQYGFPNPYEHLSSILNSEFIQNEILIIEESTNNMIQYILIENFTLFDLYSTALSKFAGDTMRTQEKWPFTKSATKDTTYNNDNSSISSSYSIYNNNQYNIKPKRNSFNIKSTKTNNSRSIQEEIDQISSTVVYMENEDDANYHKITNVILDCKDYIPNYQYVLWMYNWIICTNLGPTPKYDVDGICPKLCRPRENITDQAFIQQFINLTFKPVHIINPFDVCSQLLHTISGTCLIHGNGVSVNEFTCQCKSNAYEWQTVNSLTGCLLIPAIINNKHNSFNKTWNIECNHEMSKFCHHGTHKCYQRLQRINYQNNNINNELTLTSDVTISTWPHCLCKIGFTGIDCSIPYEPCHHVISNALIKPQILMYSQIVPNDIDRPIILYDNEMNDNYLKSATGNWLCGTKYQCHCNIGYEKDENYSYGDNCWKQVNVQNNTIINKCSSSKYVNGDQCIHLTKGLVTYINQYNNDNTSLMTSDDSYRFNQVLMCPCQSEWNAWSDCLLNYGVEPYRFRLRSCHGDGCIASDNKSRRCISSEPTTMSLHEFHDESIQQIQFKQNYHPFWILGCLILTDMLFIILGVILFERYTRKTITVASLSSMSSSSSSLSLPPPSPVSSS